MSYDFNQVAESFAGQGIKHAFGITGSGNSLALISALQRTNIDYYPVAHEASAALMAGATCHDGCTRAVAITIKGPGFANLLPGILSNRYEARPAITVSEAYSAKAPAHQMHKRLAHETIADEIVKGIYHMDATGECVTAAVTKACTEIPGPCHIDMAATPASERVRIDHSKISGPDSAALEAALIQIGKCSRPAVVLGSWAMRRHGSADWNGLQIPTVTTAAAKGCVDEYGTFSAGIITGEISKYSPEANILQEADLVIAFGLRNQEVVKPQKFSSRLLMVDEISPSIPAGFEPDQLLNIATTNEMNKLLDALSNKSWGAKSLAKWRVKQENWILQNGWQPGRALRAMELAITEHGQQPKLVLDTGFFCTIGETIWRCRSSDEFVSSSVGRFMGVSIPTAIGLAIKDPSRPVVCIAGDGGIPPYVAEIRLAVDANLPIAFVLMSDGGYGSVAAFSSNAPAVQRAITSLSKQWWRTVETMGCNASKVTTEEQLCRTISNWSIESGPIFIEMEFEPTLYRNIAKSLR